MDKQVIITFLENYYIDTDFYLSDFGRYFLQQNNLDIFYLEKLDPKDMIEYLDIERLCIDEQEAMKEIEIALLFNE